MIPVWPRRDTEKDKRGAESYLAPGTFILMPGLGGGQICGSLLSQKANALLANGLGVSIVITTSSSTNTPTPGQ